MKSLILAALVPALLHVGSAQAEDPISMLSNNPAAGVTKLKLMDGRIVTVNGFLGEITLPGSDGNIYHVSFEDAALEATSGDSALADQMVADMVDFSTNPQNLMTITSSIVPRRARSWGATWRRWNDQAETSVRQRSNGQRSSCDRTGRPM